MDNATVAISSATLSELKYGATKSSRPEQNRPALAKFVATLEILPYDEPAAVHDGQIRAELERKGMPIGSLDTLAATRALAENVTLVTNNVREFGRVPGLSIENWAELSS